MLSSINSKISYINDKNKELLQNKKFLEGEINTISQEKIDYFNEKETLDKNLELITSVFKMRLLCLLGFMPQIKMCIQCGENSNISYFSIKDDGFKCNECGRVDKSSINICATVVDAIRYVCSAPSKKIFSFDLSEDKLKEFCIVANIYFDEKIK